MMEVLFVRIPPTTKKLMLAEIEVGRYRNQAEAANALIRAGLESLSSFPNERNVDQTVENMLKVGNES